MIHPLKSLLSLNFTSVQSKEHVPAFISFSLQNFTDAKTSELRNLQISYLMVEGGDDEEELEDPYQGGLPTCTVAKCPLFESTQSSLRKPNLTGEFFEKHFPLFDILQPFPPACHTPWSPSKLATNSRQDFRKGVCSLVLVLACTCARLYLCLLVLVLACTCTYLYL